MAQNVAQTLSSINRMPAPTWSWLKMNDAHIDLPAGLVVEPKTATVTCVPTGTAAATMVPTTTTVASAAPESVSESTSGGTPETAPAGTAPSASVATPDTATEGVLGVAGAFDTELVLADKRFAGRERGQAPGDAAARERLVAGELDPLEVPALSEYQQGALRVEQELSVGEAFRTGMGSEAYAYLRGLAGKPVVLDVPGGSSATVRVELDGRIGAARATAIDVIARRGSTLDLVIALDGVYEGAFSRTQLGAESGQTSSTSPQNSAPQAPSTAKPAKTPAPGAAHIDARSCAGLIGSSLRIFAGSAARVRVTYVQTADDAFIALDDTGILLDEGARVDISHTILGAGTSCTGLAADLRGDTSRLEVRTSYLGVREQIRDFNYALRHLGRRTRSDMDANGVLAGASTKVLRGTIDLMHGCSGSEGSEHETVLIADERVENKTVPVILCDEDDVAGNHGATIGHVRPNQLFYLSSRGISETQAEALFTSAKLEDAAHAAPTKKIRAAVARLADRMGVDLEEEIA